MYMFQLASVKIAIILSLHLVNEVSAFLPIQWPKECGNKTICFKKVKIPYEVKQLIISALLKTNIKLPMHLIKKPERINTMYTKMVLDEDLSITNDDGLGCRSVSETKQPFLTRIDGKLSIVVQIEDFLKQEVQTEKCDEEYELLVGNEKQCYDDILAVEKSKCVTTSKTITLFVYETETKKISHARVDIDSSCDCKVQ